MDTGDLHIEPAVLPLLATCAVCRHIDHCDYYDRDLQGYICRHCSGFVIAAETLLRKFLTANSCE